VTDDAPAAAQTWDRFFAVYREMPRGGPGTPEAMGQALDLTIGLPAAPRVLDLGCGPGSGSALLAARTNGRVTALDLHAPFVAQQAAASRALPGAAPVTGVCADMRAAPFADGTFDLVWSEGALYSIGFRDGVDVCARLVRPGGYLAASEAVWTVPDPPDEVRKWWETEYPDIQPISSKVSDVSRAGFAIVGHFTLPRAAWWDHYYLPMRARVQVLRAAWANDDAGLGVLAQLEHEIAMFERFGHTYSYEFIVGRRVIG
jgi:SAM-dependent methyltransferase